MWGGRQATVGAGLPVIATLKHLVDTGDRILRVEGVFSGTLSFIFNSLSPGRAFSEVVREARTPRNFFACHSVVTYLRLVLPQGAPSAGRCLLGPFSPGRCLAGDAIGLPKLSPTGSYACKGAGVCSSAFQFASQGHRACLCQAGDRPRLHEELAFLPAAHRVAPTSSSYEHGALCVMS